MRIDSARVTDTLTVDADFVVTVDDGSGSLKILMEEHIPFGSLAFSVPGADLGVSGLLVPAESGAWWLKPRCNADLVVNAPVIPIADARAKPVGELVFIDGVALTGRNHLWRRHSACCRRFGSGRATRVRQAVISPGDSVRLIGRIAIREGQPVVDDAEPFTLGFSRTPRPTEIATDVAATVDGGLLDAALVKVYHGVAVYRFLPRIWPQLTFSTPRQSITAMQPKRSE